MQAVSFEVSTMDPSVPGHYLHEAKERESGAQSSGTMRALRQTCGSRWIDSVPPLPGQLPPSAAQVKTAAETGAHVEGAPASMASLTH